MQEAHPRLRNCMTSHVLPVRNKEVYVYIIRRNFVERRNISGIQINLVAWKKGDLNYYLICDKVVIKPSNRDK